MSRRVVLFLALPTALIIVVAVSILVGRYYHGSLAQSPSPQAESSASGMSPESTSAIKNAASDKPVARDKNAAPAADFSSSNVKEGYSIPLSLNNPTDPDRPNANPFSDFTYAFDCG